ncbi:DUF1572 family protein [Chryseobacterium sp.]|uniref:DUF1572 family protein n=1 Tax=Chryseobacterium sp. TaxID=1871047 RepID=UPI0038900BBD
MKNNYLEGVVKQFQYYKILAEKTFEQLSEQDLNWKNNDESNSIATVIQHISGNMLSRWTDFLTTDGEKTWRNRDKEFAENPLSSEDIITLWKNGWKCLLDTLASLIEENLEKIVYIRNEGHTVVEAINRQLAHYPYHIGQIVFIGKMIANTNWKSLSIPKGNSAQYNDAKFSKEKGKTHFTDKVLLKKPL